MPWLAPCHQAFAQLVTRADMPPKPAELSCGHSQRQVEPTLMEALHAASGHLADKGQPQDTLVPRNGVTRAAVCGLDRLEPEEVEDRPRLSRESCAEGWRAWQSLSSNRVRPAFTRPCARPGPRCPLTSTEEQSVGSRVHLSSGATPRCASGQRVLGKGRAGLDLLRPWPWPARGLLPLTTVIGPAVYPRGTLLHAF